MDILYEIKENYGDDFISESDDSGSGSEEEIALIPSETLKYDNLGMNFYSLVERVRSLSKQLKKTKAVKVLKKYSDAKMIIDCPTRWNSLGNMLKRFICNCEINSVQKACLDLGIQFNFTSTKMEDLAEISNIVSIASDIIVQLVNSEANLNTSDSVVSQDVSKLNLHSSSLTLQFSEAIQKCFLERGIQVSDILAYFLSKKVNQNSNLFYTKPPIDVMKKFIKIFNSELIDHPFEATEQADHQNIVCISMIVDLEDDNPRGDIDSAIALFKPNGILSALKPFVKNLIAIKSTSTENERSFSLAGIVVIPRSRSIKDDLLNAIIVINRFYRN